MYNIVYIINCNKEVKLIFNILESATKHGLTEADITFAWENIFEGCERHDDDDDFDCYVSFGTLPNGNVAELLWFYGNNEDIVIFHAMTPPTKTLINELERKRRQ